MQGVVVRTKGELKQAKENNIDLIIVEGELAKKVMKGKTIAHASAATIALVGVSVAAMPATGGLSSFALMPIAAMTGIEIAALAAVCFLGAGFLIALFKDYEEIDFDAKALTLKLRRKQKN
ncbi:hypothetical protein HFD91_11355 [Enterobacteriaceae bacterium EKM102V]|uniref:hypothetical protein n=1 Tax=Pantoea TaxID=53335 RepID=UPI00026D253C|nr:MULTISPECIES: hypothetical protein [Pantoea]KAF6660608.1 hypothetical protein HFD91_11355 [Enterobacteriaceae bacterium EKM102V]KAF6669553.1 hypothetical protein HFD97_06655 [Pantoea sp. EKM103V]MBO0636462.1 hypothetical protein [Pantoea agglomerans]